MENDKLSPEQKRMETDITRRVEEYRRSAGDPVENNDMLKRLIHAVNQKMNEGQIADIIGVQLQGLKKTLSLVPRLDEGLIEGRDEATQGIIAQLYRACMGGTITQKITEKINAKNQRTVQIETEEHPPSVQAMIFWLCNVDPDRWKTQADLKRARKRSSLGSKSKDIQPDQVARFAEKVLGTDSAGPKRKP